MGPHFIEVFQITVVEVRIAYTEINDRVICKCLMISFIGRFLLPISNGAVAPCFDFVMLVDTVRSHTLVILQNLL